MDCKVRVKARQNSGKGADCKKKVKQKKSAGKEENCKIYVKRQRSLGKEDFYENEVKRQQNSGKTELCEDAVKRQEKWRQSATASVGEQRRRTASGGKLRQKRATIPARHQTGSARRGNRQK